MFGGKKKSLIKKIWRRRVKLAETTTTSTSSPSTKCTTSRLPYPPPIFSDQHQQQQNYHHHHHPLSQTSSNFGVTDVGRSGGGGPRSPLFPTGTSSVPELALKTAVSTMLNQLSVEQLQNLEKSLNEGHTAPCVLVPREEVALGVTGLRVSPGYLSLAVWRVLDLPGNAVIRSVPPCVPDSTYACINPYHNAVCCYTHTDSPPPPYRERPLPPDRLRPPDHQDSLSSKYSCPSSRYESQETGCRTHSYGWCSICYWEKNRRVGQKVEVTHDTVNVVGSENDLVGKSAVCLNLLSGHGLGHHPEEVNKIKNRVGLGVLICREESEVWLYNQSSIDVFVSSATLPPPANEPPRIDQTVVHKIHPGHTQEIFNFNLAQHLLRSNSAKRTRREGPIDVFCVNVSFCKGWGPNYKRQEIMECPCWLQLHLAPPR